MTKINFYILPDDTDMARIHFACRLTEKAVAQQHRVFIAVETPDDADHFSEALWQFKPESFVGHEIQEPEITSTSPVLIGWQESPHYHGLMINLCSQIPAYFSRFQRLAEVVNQQPDVLTITRTHFQFYRDRGYPLESHNIGG